MASNHTVIIFGISHPITDVSTNLVICKEFVDILNDLMKGIPVSGQTYSLSPPYAEKLATSTPFLRLKIRMKKTYKYLLQGFEKKTTFNGLLPLNPNCLPDTRVISHIFSEEISQKLISQCKENQTTVHSCIVTAANASYFDLIRRKSSGPVKEVTVYYADAINLRRYYPQQRKEHIGCHVTAVEQKCVLSMEELKDFWETARKGKASLHESLANKSCLDALPDMKEISLVFLINKYRNKRKKKILTYGSYITTNMGDVTKILSGLHPNDPVHVTDWYRFATSTVCGSSLSISFQTFRKRLYLSFDCYKNKISNENAQELFDILKAKVTSLALSGSIV